MAARKSSRVNRKYKTKYRIRNWKEYERGLRSRGDVTIWLSEEAIAVWTPPKTGLCGGQRRYSNLAILTALALRVVFRLPLRQTEGFLDSLLSLMGLEVEAPDHTTLSRRGRIVQQRPGLLLFPSPPHVQALVPIANPPRRQRLRLYRLRGTSPRVGWSRLVQIRNHCRAGSGGRIDGRCFRNPGVNGCQHRPRHCQPTASYPRRHQCTILRVMSTSYRLGPHQPAGSPASGWLKSQTPLGKIDSSRVCSMGVGCHIP